MAKINSNGEKQCSAHKAYRSYGKPRESSEYTAMHTCITHRISICKLQRIAIVAHNSNMTLRRNTKENKS